MQEDKALEQLTKHEGYAKHPYTCTSGKLTIGIGRNLEDVGLSDQEITILFKNDLDRVVSDLKSIFGAEWSFFTEARQLALIDMRFNLGHSGFRSFRRMIEAVQGLEWEKAAREAKDSAWFDQVQGSRSDKIIRQLRHG